MAALVLRCDENAETGLGHFARCRDLARLLRAQQPGLPLVFAGDFSAYGQAQLAQHGFQHLGMAPGEALLPPGLEQAVGAEARLLVDSYRLDAAAVEALTAWRAPWGVFDDFGQFDYAGGQLVINSRVGATAQYRAEYQAIGPSYFPATPELEQARASRAPGLPEAPSQVLVFIGGSDHFAVGPRLAEAAAQVFGAARVICVQAQPLGASERIEQRPLGSDLAPLLATSDLVLAGGGRLKYEALYCQLPCASVSQTSGQAEDTAELAERGLCVDLGLARDFASERVQSALAALWHPAALAATRAAQARDFPADAGARLALKVSVALALE